MRKKISIVLAFVMCSFVVLSGCGNQAAQTDSSTLTSEETSVSELNTSEEIVEPAVVDEPDEVEPAQEEPEIYYLKKYTEVESYYDSEGNLDNQNTYVSEYNTYGDIIRGESTQYGEYSCSEYEYEYEFDDDGRVIKSTQYKNGEESSSNDYVYDSEGQLIELTMYVGGEVWRRHEYNAHGDLVRDEFMPAEIVYEYTYEYDANGNPTSSDDFVDGELSCHTEYEYDEHGNLIKATCSDDKGTNWNNYVIEYEYDDNGNLIKETKQLQNGTIVGEYEYELVK